MKLFGCIFLFFFFSCLGLYGCHHLEKRIAQLKSLEKAVLSLKREIDFHLSPLSVAFLHTAEKSDEPWSSFFKNAGSDFSVWDHTEEMRCPADIFMKELKIIRNCHPWDKDLDVLKRLGKRLGELDKKMQIMNLSLAEEEIGELLKEAWEEKQAKGKLYQTLGVCMGILSVILLI